MKGEVDKTLREEQAGFRQDRSCTDQIATLRIIVEQSIEWNSSLYVNFVDYEKAFDSLDRETLWKILRHYGVPMKLVKIRHVQLVSGYGPDSNSFNGAGGQIMAHV